MLCRLRQSAHVICHKRIYGVCVHMQAMQTRPTNVLFVCACWGSQNWAINWSALERKKWHAKSKITLACLKSEHEHGMDGVLCLPEDIVPKWHCQQPRPCSLKSISYLAVSQAGIFDVHVTHATSRSIAINFNYIDDLCVCVSSSSKSNEHQNITERLTDRNVTITVHQQQ